MPRYNRRRTYRKRRPASGMSKFIKGGSKALALAMSAYQGVKYLKGLVNSEVYKFDQVANPDTALPSTGYFQSLVGIAQGDGDATRTGNSLLIKGVRMMSTIQNNSTNPVPFTRIRCMILLDKQEIADSSYPALTDILDQTGEYVSTSALNSNTVGRFTKLYDKVHTHDLVNRTSSIFYKYIPLNKHVRFNGSAATDIQKNNIFVVWMCDNTNASFNNPILHTWQLRTYYHDN